MVHSPFGAAVGVDVAFGVIALGDLFGDITIFEPGEVEHRAGWTADRRRRSDLLRQHR
jgi:hypothetical protein